MKKIIALVMVLAMMLSLAACGASKVKNDNGVSTVEKGKLTVALSPDFAPMEFVDTSKTGQDQYVGFDVTLAKFIADELGFELVIKPMDFDACQAAVASETVDISISGYSYTDERAANYLLSDYYHAGDNETEQVIITLKENAGKWTKAEDFANLKVGAQTASLQLAMCQKQLPSTTTIQQFKDIGTAVEALRNGNIDALAVAYGNGKSIISNNDAVDFTGFEFEVAAEQEDNVVMINKNDKAMLDAVNAALAKANENHYYGQWYADAEELANGSSSAEISFDEKGNQIK